MKDMPKRIAAARKLAGLNQSEVARRLGITPQAVQGWESGKSAPRGERLLQLAKLLGVTPHYLMSGEGPRPEEHANVIPTLQPHRQAKEYPLISWVAAGSWTESCTIPCREAAEEWLESTENAGEYGYWLEVDGESMMASSGFSFIPGVRILVQPEGFDLISGKLYIAKLLDTGETTFKQYVRDAGIEYLRPLNPAFRTLEITDNVRIIGRVIDARPPKSVF